MTGEAIALRTKLLNLVTEFGEASITFGIQGASDNPLRTSTRARLAETRKALHDAIYEVCDRLRDHEEHAASPSRLLSDDEQAGMDWWNALSESERGKWLERAGGNASAADAWELFKNAALLFRDVVALDQQLAVSGSRRERVYTAYAEAAQDSAFMTDMRETDDRPVAGFRDANDQPEVQAVIRSRAAGPTPQKPVAPEPDRCVRCGRHLREHTDGRVCPFVSPASAARDV